MAYIAGVEGKIRDRKPHRTLHAESGYADITVGSREASGRSRRASWKRGDLRWVL